MKLEIQHFSQYKYSERVVLNPHLLFLIPQQRSYFKVERSRVQIHPEPDAVHERIDMLGNTHYQTWFQGETDSLSIEVDYIINIYPFNPFGFLFTEFIAYPFSFFQYSTDKQLFLQAFLHTEKNLDLGHYASQFMNESKDLVSFLFNLTESIHNDWKHIIREEENLWSADFTFKQQKGSCRDLSWMLVHILRNIGLASRFISGYAYNPELKEGHELHAWVEVYLPGAGWIGLDPSLGLFTDNHYIPLATGYSAELVSPVQGNFGGSALSELKAEVWIRRSEG
ncbi:transglutaminase family protein [Cecembia sp.]|uniref:transglutaminase family protein n=1 Tax=Cecembia sp. TaxID=1898110 RepID=UPI0025BE05DE|nr:transglutaminase family protein [Cecembia sp.]